MLKGYRDFESELSIGASGALRQSEEWIDMGETKSISLRLHFIV